MHCSAYLIRFLKKRKRTVFANCLLTCSALWTKPLQGFIARLSKFYLDFSGAQKDPLNSETLLFCTYKVSTPPGDQPLLHQSTQMQKSRAAIKALNTFTGNFPTHQSWEQALQAHRQALSSAQQGTESLAAAPPAPRAQSWVSWWQTFQCNWAQPRTAVAVMKKSKQNKPIPRLTIPWKTQMEAPTTEIKSICHLCRQQDFNGSLPRKGYELTTLLPKAAAVPACEYKPWPESSTQETVTPPGSQTSQTF